MPQWYSATRNPLEWVSRSFLQFRIRDIGKTQDITWYTPVDYVLALYADWCTRWSQCMRGVHHRTVLLLTCVQWEVCVDPRQQSCCDTIRHVIHALICPIINQSVFVKYVGSRARKWEPWHITWAGCLELISYRHHWYSEKSHDVGLLAWQKFRGEHKPGLLLTISDTVNRAATWRPVELKNIEQILKGHESTWDRTI